jgi:hypothetical protein
MAVPVISEIKRLLNFSESRFLGYALCPTIPTQNASLNHDWGTDVGPAAAPSSRFHHLGGNGMMANIGRPASLILSCCRLGRPRVYASRGPPGPGQSAQQVTPFCILIFIYLYGFARKLNCPYSYLNVLVAVLSPATIARSLACSPPYPHPPSQRQDRSIHPSRNTPNLGKEAARHRPIVPVLKQCP